MRLPFGLEGGPDALRVSEIRHDRRQPPPPGRRGPRPAEPTPTPGPGLNEWMLDYYAQPGFSLAARELRQRNKRRHDAAQMNRPTRVA